MPTAHGRDLLPRQHEPGAHSLLVSDTAAHGRPLVSAWVDQQLTLGAKVYYKGWLRSGTEADQHWLTGPHGPSGGRAALERGQLEFLDFPSVVERCGGTTEGLLRLLDDECRRAVDDGWTGVAMSQETTHRPMADDAEAAEFARQERGYGLLATRWPLTTLCQLCVDVENRSAAWESVAVHYRGITDGRWSSSYRRGRWQLRGELDAHVALRFSAAVCGALRDALGNLRGPDLYVDLAAVEFMDLTCAHVLMINARSVAPRQRIILLRTSDFLRQVLVAAERPGSVLFDDETGHR